MTKQNEETEPGISLRISQCYLEVARAIFTSFSRPNEQDIEQKNLNEALHNAILSITTVTIIYSYMAIEAFVNFQFYKVWNSRHNGTVSSDKFLQKFGDVKKFEDLKNTNISNLGERIKEYCDVKGYIKIHKKDPKLWQDFKELVEDARHFLIHPFPDPTVVQQKFSTILSKTGMGKYVEVAEAILTHFYEEGRIPKPDWLKENKLIRIRGIDFLPE